MILTSQKPATSILDNFKNQKETGKEKDKTVSVVLPLTEDMSNTKPGKVLPVKKHESFLQLQKQTTTLVKPGQDLSSVANSRVEGKGPGVRASTIQKEPGSTNINFLQAQQLVQLILPQKRYGHTSTIIDNKLYLFGGAKGKGNGATTFHSFYDCSLNIDSNKDDLFKWKRILGEAPKPRDSHTSVSFLD